METASNLNKITNLNENGSIDYLIIITDIDMLALMYI